MLEAKRIKVDISQQSSARIHPILPEELIEDTPLIQVYIKSIKNPKTTSRIIITLNNLVSLPQLSHLKRVKGKEVLLLPRNLMEIDEVDDFLKSKGFDVDLLANDVKTVSVAKIPPRTKQQYVRVNNLWPCNFHSDKYLEKLVTNSLFSLDEIDEHEQYMKIAILVAKKNSGHRRQGVVIVDPKINSIVALGYSDIQENPLKHAVMMAIDNVAKTQTGGAWISFKSTQKSSAEILNMSGIHPELYKILQEMYPNQKFGATEFKGKEMLNVPSDGPYLCTNYYLYSTHEPCIMCSMALVHSRIKRVFYGAKSQKGGLGTLCKIHTVKDLNHHYEVFGDLCEIECNNL